jgi:hypothetical protein
MTTADKNEAVADLDLLQVQRLLHFQLPQPRRTKGSRFTDTYWGQYWY